ncbi:hypothetical protein GWI33_004699 [Rhynchophorus ferrugineus]|uniref:CCR4-NOT transcription complex subunit 4 n=1 Tax=Rhynchophorus ferrugineus TaxID=354439 RepID=A0A834ISU6_RHYFE|nr:hypothetical protein GWI33_004699 [Rhynchophorus ferrugineus]
MSVLNQSGEEQVECPLCMEPLEVDDLNFFPCTCGYQICRFCWHRIRLDENGGLCPACRKAYSEDPADFIPLSMEQVAKLKAEKRQRDQQRKAKLTEGRKYLTGVRIVQKNLVFVVGLPPRLADPDILKRHEYFGKFGKIHKVVINQSTSYAGSQGPSASAYVTYMKSDDALRAIQAVNNVTIDNRVIKSSLGTTKYCSTFLKHQPCTKLDCMYLHENGDPEAIFSKEEMHAGKHQEYEKKLHEELLARTKAQNGPMCATENKGTQSNKSTKDGTVGVSKINPLNTNASNKESSGTSKESWPQLDKEKKQEKDKGSNATKTSNDSKIIQEKNSSNTSNSQNSSKTEAKETDSDSSSLLSANSNPSPSPSTTQTPPLEVGTPPICTETTIAYSSATSSGESEDNSYFSSSGFNKIQSTLDVLSDRENKDESRLNGDSDADRHLGGDALQEEQNHQVLTDTLPSINTTEDWAAAFGFAGQRFREQEMLQQKLSQRDVSKLSNFPGFGPVTIQENAFEKGLDNFSGFYDLPKLEENLIDVLTNKSNGFNVRTHETNTPLPAAHMSNGLGHNMSKFFSDYHKYSSKEPPSSSPYPNNLNGVHNPYHNMLPQKQLEEQLMNLGISQNSYLGAQTTVYQNGLSTPTYSNGDSSLLNSGLSSLQHLYHKQLMSPPSQNSRNSEAELDFDPFQETQKALAEMMANEQNHKTSINSSGRNGQHQLNGLVQNNQNGNHILPPPPGFLQQQTHMNSFGSKILPFLKMSNSQQVNNSSNNWPTNFNTQMQQPQKNVTSTDWKVLDPAILSSSRNFQLAQIPPSVRETYPPIQPLGNQQISQNGLLRSFDYPQNNSQLNFSTFTQQLQPNFNTFTRLNTPQNLNWFTNDLNSQISSPPGFRNSQTSKQQEC